jgi:hypothetical protein
MVTNVFTLYKWIHDIQCPERYTSRFTGRIYRGRESLESDSRLNQICNVLYIHAKHEEGRSIVRRQVPNLQVLLMEELAGTASAGKIRPVKDTFFRIGHFQSPT